MGALAVAVLVTVLGALAGWHAARRLGPAPAHAREPRLRVAQATVRLLGATAGAQIASQLYDLVHRLQLNAKLDVGFGGRLLHDADVYDVSNTLRNILFYGVLLIGLTTAVALIAERERGRAGA